MCGFVQISGLDQREVFVHCSSLFMSTASATNPCRFDKTTYDNVYNVVTNDSTCFQFVKGIAGFSVSQLVKNLSYRWKAIAPVDVRTSGFGVLAHWVKNTTICGVA